MNATFRLRRYYRNMAVGGVIVFLAWGVFGVFIALTAPDIKNRLAVAAFMGGVPLFMEGLSLWVLMAYWREELTIRGESVTKRGVVWWKEIGLREVTEARWRTRPVGGGLLLRSEAARLSIEFNNYEDEESDRIVRHLRSVLRPEVQTDWNLFVYKIASRGSRSAPRKPDPDEVLLRRDRWNRYFAPAFVVFCLAGFVGWRITGEKRLLIAPPLLPLTGWALMRAATPAKGMVVQKLSSSANPEFAHFFRFVLLWGLVGVAGVMAHDGFRRRLTHPDAALIVGGIFWAGILCFEAGLHDRRRSRRTREAADLAAKARSEAATDPWQAE